MHIVDVVQKAFSSELSSSLTRSCKKQGRRRIDSMTENDDPRARSDFLDRIRRYEHPIDYEPA